MNKGKTDKETSIKSILSDLKKGIGKPAILSKYVAKCHKSVRTVERWYDSANEQYQEFLKIAKPIIEAKEIEALGEIAKAGILSKLERQLILSEFAKGTKVAWKESVSRDGVVKLDSYDPLKYIAELNKMDGAYIVEDEKVDDKITSITIRRISNES